MVAARPRRRASLASNPLQGRGSFDRTPISATSTKAVPEDADNKEAERKAKKAKDERIKAEDDARRCGMKVAAISSSPSNAYFILCRVDPELMRAGPLALPLLAKLAIEALDQPDIMTELSSQEDFRHLKFSGLLAGEGNLH